jgi:hypothetical protein
MTNAKEELLLHLRRIENSKGRPIPIKCATISRGCWYDNDDVERSTFNLKEGHTQKEYEEFLKKLDFEYDNGYGGQELFGKVWLTEEGTWYERGEYDGSEWWEYQECPPIPDNLKAN